VRIARIMTRLNLGGPARQALASDTQLAERGHAVRLFAGKPEPGEGDLFDHFRERGLDVVRVPGLSRGLTPLGDLRAARSLQRELAAFAPDLVHTHASKAGALGRRAARSLDLPAVHTFHGHVLEGYFPDPVSKWIVKHERRMARSTARILAVSHATADDLLRLGICEEERLVVVPPGVELEPLLAVDGRSGLLRGELGVGEDAFLVGVLGRLAEVKRPELALEVFDLLAPRHPRLELCFVGDGEGRGALERGILGGSEVRRARVHLAGARADMPAVLADLDAVLLTSRSEGAPVALIEAAAAARPVVATPVGGVPEIVVHERTGYLGEDVTELAYGLDQLLSRPAEGRAMGHRGRLRVAERHSAGALAGRLEAVYKTVLEEARCGS
jgi:glycosyltransferase involved in cell wall biosynthesis